MSKKFTVPTVKFYTLGCKVNQYETQAIRESFLRSKFRESKNDKADIYIINTCTVTQTADRKSRGHIYRCIRENPDASIVVTGCYVQKDKDQITKIDGVDFIVPNENKDRIVDIFVRPNKKIGFIKSKEYQDFEISEFANHCKAFVKIQDGCNNRCSYCKIPFVRGRSRSRRPESIVKEVVRIIKNGFREVVLTGICLGAYGKDLKQNIDLVSVIDEIEKIDGEFRIRLSSIEAKDVTDRLISKITNSKKICRHLHIPFQSGDDEILKLMARDYTVDYYRQLVNKIRTFVPEIAITTDIMVGFPSETEERFRNTLSFLKEISPSRMHIFPFSPRKQTRAFLLPNRIDTATVKKRLNLLKNLAKEKSYTYRKQFFNKELEVLVEDKPDKRSGLPTGYSDNYIKILIQEKEIPTRKLCRVKPIKITKDFTLAKLLRNS